MADTTDNGVQMAVGMLVFALVAVYTAPIAIDQWYSVETTEWPSEVTGLWELGPIFIVLALVLFVIMWALRAADFV